MCLITSFSATGLLLIALATGVTGCDDAATAPADSATALDAANSIDIGVDLGVVDAAQGLGDAAPMATAAEQAAFAALVAYAKTDLSLTGVPGAGIAVVLHGNVLLAAGVGLREAGTPNLVTTATRFRVGSLSKMLVAATALSVVDEGKLDLHAPITTYIPWFKLAQGFDAGTITLHHLLTHSAGFPCDVFPFCQANSSGDRQTWFTDNPQPLWAPPGTVWDYSNYGFSLAAVVIASAAGVGDSGFEQLVHDRVFVPAGMSTATYYSSEVLMGDYAFGHVLKADGTPGQEVDASIYDCPLLHPPGGIGATSTDYGHWIETLLAGGGTMLSPAAVQTLETGYVSLQALGDQTYAYGLITQTAPFGEGTPLVWHDGSLPGYLSELWMVPGRDFGAVVLLNASGGNPDHPPDPEDILAKALALFVPDAEHWGQPESDPATWSRYAGVYEDPYGALGTATITYSAPDGGTPSLSINAPKLQLHDAMQAGSNDDEWFLSDGEAAHFYSNDGGVYNRLVTRLGVGIRQ